MANERNQNQGNERTVHNPQKPGTVEKVNPSSGETAPESTNPEKR